MRKKAQAFLSILRPTPELIAAFVASSVDSTAVLSRSILARICATFRFGLRADCINCRIRAGAFRPALRTNWEAPGVAAVFMAVSLKSGGLRVDMTSMS